MNKLGKKLYKCGCDDGRAIVEVMSRPEWTHDCMYCFCIVLRFLDDVK